MFLSSSFIIINVNSSIGIVEHLTNSYFKRQKKGLESEDYSFYSINFYNDEKTTGEIHWSESFYYGKMNLINFMRRGNQFILFTSSVQNYKIFKLVLEKLIGNTFEIEIIKIPIKYELVNNEIEEIVSIEGQDIFGISVILDLQGKYSLMKIYTNGLITYSMTNDYKVVERNIDIALEIIDSLKGSDGS